MPLLMARALKNYINDVHEQSWVNQILDGNNLFIILHLKSSIDNPQFLITSIIYIGLFLDSSSFISNK